jgi:NAD(P)-dependent dehydrogenase (short-subunit alcohol dehydrogenase family)
LRGLPGKVVVVAGAGSGIGQATARRLGAEGASVVVGDLNTTGAEDTAASINDDGGRAIAVTYDAGDAVSVKGLADAAVAHFGCLDGWHNNAADTSATTVGVDMESDALSLPLEIWYRTFQVNLEGYVHGVRAAIPLMLQRGGGAFAHTASDGAFGGFGNLSAYNAAKAGVLSLNRHVATRWGPSGVRSNVVSPGFVLTESTKASLSEEQLQTMSAAARVGKVGSPDDLAAAVAFLLSDDARYINGQVLSVNGGSLMR